MKQRLRPGLYEDLVTTSLKREIEILREDSWSVETGRADDSRLAGFLTSHVADLLCRALDGMPAERQIALVNRVLDMLGDHGVPDDAHVTGAADLLLAVVRRQGLEDSPTAAERPIRSLRDTGLLVNGRRDVQVSGEIVREIPSADGIDLLCAFVRYSGLRLFRRELEERGAAGIPVRVITTVYTGSTERRALDALHDLGARVKVSYDVDRTRLHAKAWLFRRESGLDTAYIGSSNLTHTAQVDGLEWNVRLSAARNPEVIGQFRATFEQYWEESEFEPYDPERDGSRLDGALRNQRGHAPGITLPIDAVAKPHQEEVLEALESERRRGHQRNLVVAATGTGKTWVAAFDFRRLRRNHQVRSLLFVAHRKEILEQSQRVFQIVLRDPSFGERLVAGERPRQGRHVFASVQSLHNRVDGIDPSGFDVVIIDEFHHAAASSYERLLNRLRPRFLLGLTATPERTDGQSILGWFDGRIASESRLWDALDQGLLCPFHYFGINDGTDLTNVRFRQGRYMAGDLDRLFTGDHARVRRIIQAVGDHVPDPQGMRALGFCAGVSHAHFMADEFSRSGLNAAALDNATPHAERTRALSSLRTGDLHIIFTVDLFNEGVDIREVDTILMLRPTESATVFLQQLGRGLRWAEGKQVLTVLDFVGQARREYRFDMRYQALVGGTRQQVRKAVEENFPYLPPGCALRLDRIARQTVLDNLSRALGAARHHLVERLRTLGPSTRLGTFVNDGDAELLDIYRRPSADHCFNELRERAGFASPSSKGPFPKALGRMLHVNDRERFETWRAVLTTDESVEHLPLRRRRLAWMFFGLLAGSRPLGDADEVLSAVRARPEARDELIDLLDILEDRTRTLARPLEDGEANPLASHATYSLVEITAAYGLTDARRILKRPREGVLRDKTTGTDLLFITLEKSEKDYAPSVRYADYPISPHLFHWETQNTTSPDSRTGQRYIAGTGKVLLFVRERKRDDRNETRPYHCLGYASCRRHESSRPMKIVWELERMMPGWLYQAGKVVAG